MSGSQNTEIVRVNECGDVFTTSLIVAEVFEKRHDDVLKAIRRMLSDLEDEEYRLRNFAETSVSVHGPNGGVRSSPAYSLTRDAFSLLAMGFTGKAALAWKVRFIEAFNAMEKELQKQLLDRAVKAGTEELLEVPFSPRKPCTEDQLDALRGILYLMSRFDDTSEEEAEHALCHALRIEDLSQLARADFQYAFDYCWRNTHRILPSQRVGDESTELRHTMQLISLAAHQSGVPIQHITDYICQMCGISDLDEGRQCTGKVILTAWGVLVRVTDDHHFSALLE